MCFLSCCAWLSDVQRGFGLGGLRYLFSFFLWGGGVAGVAGEGVEGGKYGVLGGMFMEEGEEGGGGG